MSDETRRRLEALRDRLRVMQLDGAVEDIDDILALPAASPPEGCTKKFVACDADDGGPETWCDNCRARRAADPPDLVAHESLALAHEEYRLLLAEHERLVALVRALEAHAREHNWQDVDEPIAALLAYPLAEDTDGGGA